MPGYVEQKDPDETRDYSVDWSTYLGTDTISTSTWTVPTGLTGGTESNTATTATVWLSGGVGGQEYEVLNEITTVAGRTYQKTLVIPVLDD